MAVQQSNSVFQLRVGDWYHADVSVLPAAQSFIDEHKLTPSMVEELAKVFGRYPIANERTLKALVKRGLMEQKPDESFQLTILGAQVCAGMFQVKKLRG